MCNVYYVRAVVPLNCIHMFNSHIILITLISIFFPYNMVATLVRQDPLPKGRKIGENDSVYETMAKISMMVPVIISRFLVSSLCCIVPTTSDGLITLTTSRLRFPPAKQNFLSHDGCL